MPEVKGQLAQRRSAIWIVIILAVVILGIIVAMRIQLIRQNTNVASTMAGTIISEIQFGALLSPVEADKLNPRIQQKQFYTTSDRLVMRLTTTPEVTEPFEVAVRLLTPSGSIVELNPPSATFTPGTSSFCCWQITKEGTYTLQIFRPEKTVSTIPLVIQKGTEPGPSGKPNYNNIQVF